MRSNGKTGEAGRSRNRADSIDLFEVGGWSTAKLDVFKGVVADSWRGDRLNAIEKSDPKEESGRVKRCLVRITRGACKNAAKIMGIKGARIISRMQHSG